MKKQSKFLLMLSALVLTSLLLNSCSTGYGCPAENANAKMDRKGNFGSKKGNSNLFPKDMRKRVRVN
jgi:hypothetical protein